MIAKKNKLIAIFVMSLVALCCFMGAVGCGSDKELSVENFDDKMVVELLTDTKLPVAYLDGVSCEGNLLDRVTYKITSPTYTEKGQTKTDVFESVFPSVYCDRVGEWKVEYIYGDQSITKSFKVVDTTSPELRIDSQPYDVWVSETEKYYLPTVFYNDSSKVDNESIVKKLMLNGNDVAIDLLDRYKATETGLMEYVFEISDIYGNKSQISSSWNIKDTNWIDAELDTGYLADFKENDYLNLVSSGDVNAYWGTTQISEQYLEQFNGVNGVLKVTAKPNSYGTGAIKLRLMDSITATELINNKQKLVLLVYSNESAVRVGCSVWQEAPETKHTFAIDVVPNQWNKISLNNAELKYGFDDMGAEINELQFTFGSLSNLLAGDVEFYIAGIAIASELGNPENVTLNGETLSWSAVDNADGYEVYENGKATRVTETSYEVTSADSVLGVRAIANDDNLVYLSSSSIIPYLDKTGFSEGDIALMNGGAYAYMFSVSDTTTIRTAKSVTAEYLPTYKGEDNVIKVTSVNNATGIGDIVMNLNRICGTGVTVRYMLESSGAMYKRFLQPHSEYGVEGAGGDMVADGEWKTVYLNYSDNVFWSTGAKDRIDVMFQGGVENDVNVIYFSVVKDGNRVEEVFQELLEKDMQAVAANLPDGYLADFSSVTYEKFVTKFNDYGTITEVEYMSEFSGEVNVLKVTSTPDAANNSGITIMLPKSMTEGTFTIRYYVDCDNVIRLRNKIGTPTDIAEPVSGSWQTLAVSGSAENNVVNFYSWGTDTLTVYISFIANGDISNS